MMVVRRSLRWIYDTILAIVQQCLINVLSAGPVPRHIAFVMDGNRRYARRNNIKVQEGHVAGFSAFHKMLDVCVQMNIYCVSVYAFSIENFKRSSEEVDALMALAVEKLLELCHKGNLFDKYSVRLNIIGRVELLPKKVQCSVQKAENMTQHNDRMILNICFAYTSRDEITTAIKECVKDGLEQNIDPDTYFTKEEVDKHLMLTARGSPPLDVLVRTSGAKRLSDFMLWQCCENTQIQFFPVHWPDCGLWEFVPIILDYQRKIYSRQRAVDTPNDTPTTSHLFAALVFFCLMFTLHSITSFYQG